MYYTKILEQKRINQLIENADPLLQRYISSLEEISNEWETLFYNELKKSRKHNVDINKEIVEVINELYTHTRKFKYNNKVRMLSNELYQLSCNTPQRTHAEFTI